MSSSSTENKAHCLNIEQLCSLKLKKINLGLANHDLGMKSSTTIMLSTQLGMIKN